ncbi:hypothetical protein DMENIID0001_159080 [Sergentomyia squamirostris]
MDTGVDRRKIIMHNSIETYKAMRKEYEDEAKKLKMEFILLEHAVKGLDFSEECYVAYRRRLQEHLGVPTSQVDSAISSSFLKTLSEGVLYVATPAFAKDCRVLKSLFLAMNPEMKLNREVGLLETMLSKAKSRNPTCPISAAKIFLRTRIYIRTPSQPDSTTFITTLIYPLISTPRALQLRVTEE